jgi:release factor glutamine methyltransferase
MNINSALSQGSKILRNNFISNSKLDAEILMAKVFNKDRKYILLNLNYNIAKNHINNFYNLIEKRSSGNPVAYLINKKFFWNSEFSSC